MKSLDDDTKGTGDQHAVQGTLERTPLSRALRPSSRSLAPCRVLALSLGLSRSGRGNLSLGKVGSGRTFEGSESGRCRKVLYSSSRVRTGKGEVRKGGEGDMSGQEGMASNGYTVHGCGPMHVKLHESSRRHGHAATAPLNGRHVLGPAPVWPFENPGPGGCPAIRPFDAGYEPVFHTRPPDARMVSPGSKDHPFGATEPDHHCGTEDSHFDAVIAENRGGRLFDYPARDRCEPRKAQGSRGETAA